MANFIEMAKGRQNRHLQNPRNQKSSWVPTLLPIIINNLILFNFSVNKNEY